MTAGQTVSAGQGSEVSGLEPAGQALKGRTVVLHPKKNQKPLEGFR